MKPFKDIFKALLGELPCIITIIAVGCLLVSAIVCCSYKTPADKESSSNVQQIPDSVDVVINLNY